METLAINDNPEADLLATIFALITVFVVAVVVVVIDVRNSMNLKTL